ncbi:clostridium P47 protein [Ilyonectria sp. MPI-CAGE-AT-0026]|nr:clostridium P47 protein [Ilyonectria sp. MPI-CAGE-AT-0026]
MSTTSIIHTNNWDTVFATTYTYINDQIEAQWPDLTAKTPTLSKIQASLSDNRASVDLNMSAWSLTQGGSGALVRLKLPISTGTFHGISGTYKLAGQTITIQLSLQWVPQPNQTHFTISSNAAAVESDLAANTIVTTNIKNAFSSANVELSSTATISIITPQVCWKITDSSSNVSYYLYVTDVEGSDDLIEVYQYIVESLVISSNSPITPVTVITAGSITDEIDGPLLMELIAKNIDQNLGEFGFVFASVDVVTQLSKNDVWAWLQPTTNEYAVVEPLYNATNDTCNFAILSMVNNNDNKKPVLQVDENAVDPNASHSLLISPNMFLTNMLAPGVSSVFTGSDPGQFTIDADNLTVTNNQKLVWGNFQLDSGKTITLSIEAEDFAMTLSTDHIKVNFTNLSFPIDGIFNIDVGSVNIIWAATFNIALQEGNDSNKTLWFNLPPAQEPISSVSTVMNQTYWDIEEASGILSMALSIIGVAGLRGAKIASNATRTALVRAGVVEATTSTEEALAYITSTLRDAAGGDAFERAAAESAIEMMQPALTNFKYANLWSSIARWCASTAAFTGFLGGGMQLYESILSNAAQKDWNSTPSFTNFANAAIQRYSFGGQSQNLANVQLKESLQLNFTTPQ